VHTSDFSKGLLIVRHLHDKVINLSVGFQTIALRKDAYFNPLQKLHQHLTIRHRLSQGRYHFRHVTLSHWPQGWLTGLMANSACRIIAGRTRSLTVKSSSSFLALFFLFPFKPSAAISSETPRAMNNNRSDMSGVVRADLGRTYHLDINRP
jgi:hypothetical protein